MFGDVAGIAAYLGSVMVFNRSVRDQEERVDAVEGMFQRSSVVVVCFADGCPGQTLFLQLFGRAGDECKALCWKAIQDVLDGSAAYTARGWENANSPLRYSVKGWEQESRWPLGCLKLEYR